MTTPRFHVPMLLFAIATSACSAQETQQAPVDPATAARQQALQTAGVAAPLTILPVRVLGRGDTNVAAAVGLVLEQHGMSDLEVAETAFDPRDLAWADVPAAFGKHVADAAPPSPRHRLYAEFLGTPRTGPTEVRFVVVDGDGNVVLVDRQRPKDPAFERTAGRDPDPFGCSQLVGLRLFERLHWRAVPGGAKEGRFAARWRRASGVPDAAERKAIDERRAALRATLATASVEIWPSLWQGKPEAASAVRLAQLLGEELGCRTTVAAAPPALEVAAGSNEQKRLWDLVRAAQRALRSHPAATDYVAIADIAFADAGARGFVHVALLSGKGEVVAAELQNDQGRRYRQMAPKGLEDGERLATAMLAATLEQ
ncbi:MAG: hypothetical protein KDE27_22970 [Planctomycetes bacterium]|nr:hypothetical protein [Planctomycetota bacterium]